MGTSRSGERHRLASMVVGPLLLLLVLGLMGGVLAAACGDASDPAGAGSTATLAVVSEQQVIDLVDLTSAAVTKDVKATFAAIDAGDKPYVDPSDPGLYAFVYNKDVTLVATPDATVRGQNMKGKADLVGRLFRDEIVAGALAMGTGWVQYVYKEPEKTGLFRKATYYKLTAGNDGNTYVVCAGRYLGTFDESQQVDVTPADVQAFVNKALAYAQTAGKEAALAAFTQKSGEFHQGQLYIYAYDFSGTVIAHGGDPTLVGKNLIDMTDPNGVHVIQELVRLATQGGGWLYYTWPNPAHDSTEEPKLGYVEKVDDTWFLGSGTYGTAAKVPPSVSDVKAFVDEAYAYARVHGKDAAIKEFMDTSGSFFRAGLYIFAFTKDGVEICVPTEPEKVGTNRWDAKDATGAYYIQELIKKATTDGSGWVRYQYANPAMGYQVQQKVSYVRQVDPDWLIGAGTYTPLE
jgi:signal transduction histidine kinase